MANQMSWEDLLRGFGIPIPSSGSDKGSSPFASSDDSSHGNGSGGSGIPDLHFKKPGPLKPRTIVVLVIVLALAIAVLYWWFHPALNIHNADAWMFVAIVILLPAFILFRIASRDASHGTKKHAPSAKRSTRFKRLSYIPVAVAVLGIVGAIGSLAFIPGNAEKYATILHTGDYDFASDMPQVNYDEIPVIDGAVAKVLGNRAMGSIPDYVSQFEISDIYSQINYQGRPVRVSPLVYADLFKWFTNQSSGIPAYVVVDMASQDTQVVRTPQPIKFSESEPLDRNIDRYVQLKFPTYMFEQKAFELDEQGNPWWVCPVQTRTIGLFGGENIERVVLVNACTGECQDYAISEVPSWVDRAYPSELLIQQYNWSGQYVHGWLNSFLGQSGVVHTTPGTNGDLGYNYVAKDDDVWLYTGVTSATSDSSIIGFVLVNQRTAESHFYSVAGATEESAMSSAEGQVQNLKYTATFPLLINIKGQPTYFMSLKDDAGLVKQFAMLDIQRYQTVAVGNTVADCQKSYISMLSSNGALSDASASDGGGLTVKGRIERMTEAVVDGNSHFYIKLKGDSHIYDCPLPSLIEVVGYGVGDSIQFTYTDGDPIRTVTAIGSGS